MANVRAISVGLGAVGSHAANESAAAGLELVAAVDPALAGQEIADLEVLHDIDALKGVEADVVMLATGSRIVDIAPQIERLLEFSLNVVSTSEELSFPRVHGEIAERLDAVARRAGRTVIGCGVNPGFLMDVLPAAVTTVTLRPTGVRVLRQADLSRRRRQLQDKVGVGLTLSEWDEDLYGHYGLVESAYLCAVTLGWQVEDVVFTRAPLESSGTVEGIREHARLFASGGREIDLELIFQLGIDEEDSVEVDGDPPLRLVFPDGVAGDKATVARLLSSARTAPEMPAGLRLPIEVPAWLGSGDELSARLALAPDPSAGLREARGASRWPWSDEPFRG